MDRKIERFGFKISGDEIFWARMGLKGRKIISIKIDLIDAAQFSSQHRISKNPGKISTLFPVEKAYLHEMGIPPDVSKRSALQMLAANFERALPFPLRGYKPYSLWIEKTKEEERFLQFILSPNFLSLNGQDEMDSVESHPGAVFQGFSELFSFPRGEISLLFLKVDEYFQIIWGDLRKVMGMRVLRKMDEGQLSQNFLETLALCSSVKHFFSWCDEKETGLLNLSLPKTAQWVHLKQGPVPAPLKETKVLEGSQRLKPACEMWENLPLMGAIYAHALGYSQPFWGPNSSVLGLLKSPGMKKMMMRSLMLILFAGLTLEALWVSSMMKIRQKEEKFSHQIEEAFYQIFPVKIPMINPAQQMREKAESILGTRSGKSIRPNEFLHLISTVHSLKNADIQITKISLSEEQLRLDGISSSLESVYQWAAALRSKFHTVELSRMDRQTRVEQFIFHLIISWEGEGHVSH